MSNEIRESPWSKKRAKTNVVVAPPPLPDDPLRLSVTLRDASVLASLFQSAKSAHMQQILIEFSDSEEDALVEISASLSHNAGWFNARVPSSACVKHQLDTGTQFTFAVSPSDGLAVKSGDTVPRTLTIEHTERNDNALRLRSCDASGNDACPVFVVTLPCQEPGPSLEINDDVYENAVRVRLLASTLNTMLPSIDEAKRLFFKLEACTDSFTLRPHDPDAKGIKTHVSVSIGKATSKGSCEIELPGGTPQDGVISARCFANIAVTLWKFAKGATSVELAFGNDQPIRARFRFGDGTVVTSYVLEAVSEDEPDYDE